MKSVSVSIERGLNGSYSAYISSNNCEFGCIGEGNTAKEAENDFLAGVEDMRIVYAEKGRPFPEVGFVFKYDVASFISYYTHILTLSGMEKITGINQRQLSHYSNGVRKPSRATREKIESSIKAFATQLADIHLL